MERYTTLLPLLGVTAYFFIALAIFHLRTLRRGLPVDAEVADKPASSLLTHYWRHYLMWVLGPWERALVRLRVPPDAITLASLASAFTAAALLGLGDFSAGGWLYLLTGILDILDGRVARQTGQVSRGGAFIDSVTDRYAELAVFSGLAVYYRTSWVLGVVLVAMAGSLMVSYTRARGEALGVDVKVGTMQRPERLFYLGVVVAHSPLWEALRGDTSAHPLYGPAVVALALLALSANLTALRRIVHTRRALRDEPGDVRHEQPAPHPTEDAEVTPGVAAGASHAGHGRRFADGVERLLARLRPVD